MHKSSSDVLLAVQRTSTVSCLSATSFCSFRRRSFLAERESLAPASAEALVVVVDIIGRFVSGLFVYKKGTQISEPKVS